MEGECSTRGECSIQAGEYTKQGECSMLHEEEAGSMLEEGEGAMLKEGAMLRKKEGEGEGEEGDSGEEGEEDDEYEEGEDADDEDVEDAEDDAEDEDEGEEVEEEDAILEGAGAMQLETVTPTSSMISTGASGGEGDNTGIASIVNLMTDSLTFTLDRKVDMELALLEDLLASLRKERLELEEDAERSAVNLPSSALLDDLVASMRKERMKVEADDARLAANSPSEA